ncbi:MAG TPA: carbamate kinase [Vicinamibacteria bacterium]|nr:carbamate kinase [Vicinamibacteria bacterium]
MPIAVAALGGNAIVSEEDAAAVDLRRAPLALARLVGLGYDLVVTHGNGPQVGQRLVEAHAAGDGHAALDILDAETVGALGYRLQQSLGNALRDLGTPRAVAAVVTQVVVDPEDPAFLKPSKPVGPFYDRARADALAAERGYAMAEDARGRGFRRVVASPQPLEVVEAEAIRALVGAGVVAIAAGGGGIPVFRDAAGRLRGVEAVVDKDRASSLLARRLDADVLVIFTDVPEVRLDFRKPGERPVRRLSVGEARSHLGDGQFPAGSMGPKVEAAADFAEATGRPAVITFAERVLDALAGTAGTTVHA